IAAKYIPFKILLLTVSLIYLYFFFPALNHFLGFLLYGYIIYYSLDYVFKLNNKLFGAILLVVPMFFVKGLILKDIISFAGLSYITFRVTQLYIDNVNTNKPVSIIDYLCFTLFPPTLLIGPIDRFERFKSDIDKGYERINTQALTDGWQIMLYGILQKYVLAELVNRYWLSHAVTDSKALPDMLNYMYAYSFYLYLDFAGYSSLAVGLSKMFGINTPENFNSPFLAVNPQDFWRRWHVTLGDWLKDYIFRPYYKWISSKPKWKQYPLFRQNSGLFVTFLAMGFWNGFKGYLIISGCIFAVYSVVHNTYDYYCRKNGRDIVFGKLPPMAIKVLSIFIMFNLACFALYVFSGKFPFIK
ncbi:MAG TPA: MBOAT family O-acyltransferase, partial [Bacteroidia bacterium]|nr:MBOAT family O-acyltransferase [Bacteroidia bacterium]